MSSPILFLHERYTPRICAAHECTEPPCATYMVATNGTLFGRSLTAGQRLDVCKAHDETAKAEVR